MIQFTIATCTYNAADTLQRTLDSVARQTYPYVEHLIIDGLSDDRTPDIIRQYAAQETANGSRHTVVTLSERDNGLYDAMNKALMKATGDYIVYLNAGDTLPSADTLDIIAASVGEAETLPAVLYGDTDMVDIEGQFVRHRRLSPPQRLSWKSFQQGMTVCHQAFYARLDVAKTCPYDLQYRYSADVDWCIRVMKEAHRRQLPLRPVNAVIANYLVGGLTRDHHKASLKERFRIMCRHYGTITTLFLHAWFVVRAVIKK